MYSLPEQRPANCIQRPERKIQKRSILERLWHSCSGLFWQFTGTRFIAYRRYLPLIRQRSTELAKWSDAEIANETAKLRHELIRHGLTTEILPKVFALVREVTGRNLGMYHFDSQLLGGLALFFGNIAEMQTGEGKTLTAILPAAAVGLAGIPVHVVTVNDYLAKRDMELMRPVYQALKLSVGHIIHGMSFDERRHAYACDVVYCTNKELVFDYLKDQLVLKQRQSSMHVYGEILKGNTFISSGLMQRGLHYAIVDEADSVLLDEARTPLIISGETMANDDQDKVYRQAMKLAETLQLDKHYNINKEHRLIKITSTGDEFIKKYCSGFGPFWAGRARRLELAQQALSAKYLFERDKHYLVRDGKVQIIDEHTGRVMEDRSWERGLHQLIEIKEDCDLTHPRETLASISYQRFFRMYHRLCGMTGTASEVAGELWSIYGLSVVRIPTHCLSRRINFTNRLFKTKSEKWQAVIDRILELHEKGRPVLIGTCSVAASEALSESLDQYKLNHNVLNAKQDQHEAEIVATAGIAGQITIATSMAGRGTDIKLTKEAEASGGLHVVLTELHDASRIDRQLQGRCARMGDPGSFEAMMSLEDSLLVNKPISPLLQFFLNHRLMQANKMKNIRCLIGVWLLKATQRKLQKNYARSRRELLKQDYKKSELLSFTALRV